MKNFEEEEMTDINKIINSTNEKQSKENIIKKIISYLIDNNVKYWKEVYVGIANDPKRRLFTEHKVSEENDIWIWCKAYSSNCAREIENEILSMGAIGGSGGGTDDTYYVYAYKITPETKQ